jgi:hypothetical protein
MSIEPICVTHQRPSTFLKASPKPGTLIEFAALLRLPALLNVALPFVTSIQLMLRLFKLIRRALELIIEAVGALVDID